MEYNRELEKKIDRLLAETPGITSKKMFGGVGYMLRGNMCCGIHKQFMVLRVSPQKAAELLQNPNVEIFDMTGRPMPGWVLISPETLKTDAQIGDMLQLGLQFAATLPDKT